MLLRTIVNRMAFCISTSTLAKMTVRTKYALFYSGIAGFAALKSPNLPNFDAPHSSTEINSYQQLDMPEKFKMKIMEAYPVATEIQRKTAKIIMDGDDLIGIAKTGSGKTLAYSLPVLLKLAKDPKPTRLLREGPRYLIICPTRELAQQIMEHVSFMAKDLNLKTAVVYGGADRTSQLMKMRDGVDILIGTPGRLMDFIGNKLNLDRLEYLTMDEADRILEIGYEEQIREIAKHMPKDTNRQTSFFSATWNKKLEYLTNEYMKKDAKYVQIGSNELSFNPDIKQQFEEMTSANEKVNRVIGLINANPTSKFLIFCNTKNYTNVIEDELYRIKIRSSKLSGDLDQRERTQNLNMFKLGTSKILIATDVASRGLDIKDVSYVINFDTPRDIESYVHRIGRTGRAGNKGTSITFLCHNTGPEFLKGITSIMRENRIPIPDQLNNFAQGKLSRFGGSNQRGNNNYSNRSGGDRNYGQSRRPAGETERYSRRSTDYESRGHNINSRRNDDGFRRNRDEGEPRRDHDDDYHQRDYDRDEPKKSGVSTSENRKKMEDYLNSDEWRV